MGSSIWEKGINSVYEELSSSPSGLSSAEAASRLKKYGQNIIPDKDRKEWVQILVSQFASPLLLILIAASLISAFIGEVLDTAIILAVIIISVFLGFFQEYKSEKVLDKLKKYFSYRAVVLRDKEKREITANELVVGDIVFVRLGDIVPADMRIIETKGMTVNEAVLTGESQGVAKGAAVPKSASSPQEITNGIFMGTTVIDGYAKCIVVATGEETFFGRTATVFSAKVPESDFQIGIRKFGSMLIRILLALTFFVFISNFALGHGEKNPLVDSMLFALALAVGITPELLPVVITIALSTGSMQLAKKKVITKKHAAVDDLGNMDVLCTDKTGTLTEEGLIVEKYIDLDEKDSHDVFEYACLCNAAVGTTHVRGSPIDVAIRKRQLEKKLDLSRFEVLDDIEFDYVRRRMGRVVREGKKTYLIVKGAPESVLSVCSKIRMKGKDYAKKSREKHVLSLIEQYGKKGYSTIGVAYREIERKKNYSPEDEGGLIFIGFVFFTNPPKSDVKPTLERLKKLNVKLKLITGDDALVAKKLCSEIGFVISEGTVVLGSDVARMNKKELSDAVEKYDVFARVTPDQKLAIVEALRENGHVVGFLGDGINDAPALRAADVGISVDSAADVAKGASHIILLQKNLSVVCDGVAEGRKIFGNITKYIFNTMSANAGNMVTVAASSLFLPFLPFLPSQILLINLITDIPLMGISSDNVDKSYTRKPQKWNLKLILNFMLFFGVISTIFDLILIGMMLLVFHTDTESFRTAWFLASVLSEIIIIFSLRTHLPFFRSMPSSMLAGFSAGACVLSIGAIHFAPIASLFYFVPLSGQLLALIAAVIVGYFAATEIGKMIFFRYVSPQKE